ncbi:hypothetical protein HF521_008831 [Silurus meridionalis]|uniref:Uncharacterized protein n=1 Tax=Silurus meridionalis TaxID=175797 RepID=A0A8T0AL93_SILME|nr:hypothetical protein HF521_008831 [Silurus meridionalis]
METLTCTMTSAVPPKRMVSSVFITLASPYRATVTPTLSPSQHSAVPISPTAAHRKPSTSSIPSFTSTTPTIPPPHPSPIIPPPPPPLPHSQDALSLLLRLSRVL